MSNNALISVIIPTYNSARYIGEAIRSVCAQTYSDLEIIVVDDGSTDNTEEIVSSISDQRVRYIKTPNKGNYFARNRGLQEARGRYIAFLDADDVFYPEKLARQMDCFAKDPELGFCCTGFYVQHAAQGKVFIDTSYSFRDSFDTAGGFIEKALKNNFMATSTVMVRKECIERVGFFDTKFQNAMDYELWLRIIFCYPARYISEPLVKRLEHNANISKNKVNTYKAVLYIFEECMPVLTQKIFYRPEHAVLIKSKLQEIMYYLGLEYLMAGDCPEAYRYLQKCRYARKRFFIIFALLVARFHLIFFIVLIKFYRRIRQRQSIVVVKK